MKKMITIYLVGCIVALILTISLNRTLFYKRSGGPVSIEVVCVTSIASWFGVFSVGVVSVRLALTGNDPKKKFNTELINYIEAKDKVNYH